MITYGYKPTAEEVLKSGWPTQFFTKSNGEDYDGSCICGQIVGIGFLLEAHCWRSRCEYGCKFSGVHVAGDISYEQKMKLAKHFVDKSAWKNHTDFNIVIE